jgi:16S rRNA (guanine527-N7)-methyltransferase
VRPRSPERGGDPFAELARAIELLTGRQATPEERRRFKRYLDLLLVWNRVQRLTGLLSPAEIVRKLFQDSLLFLCLLPQGPLVMADIGAGAGIPGVPLRIVRPEISLTLIESRRRPVSFLASLSRELDLSGTEVLEGRAEDLARQSPRLVGRFDVVVARAVGSLPELIPTAVRYLKNGGVFITSGPSPGKPRPAVPEGFGAKWEMVSSGASGLKRTFLTVSKQGVP